MVLVVLQQLGDEVANSRNATFDSAGAQGELRIRAMGYKGCELAACFDELPEGGLNLLLHVLTLNRPMTNRHWFEIWLVL